MAAKPSDSGDSLLQAAVAILPVAAAYFAGWAYLTHLLVSFSVDTTEIDVPLSTILVLAAKPLSHWSIGVLLLAWLIAAITVRHFTLNSSSSLQRFDSLWIRLPATGLILLIILYFINWRAKIEATDAVKTLVNYGRFENTPVLGYSEAESSSEISDLQTCVNRGALLQVFATEQRYILFCPDTEDGERGAVYILNSDQKLISVRTRTGLKI